MLRTKLVVEDVETGRHETWNMEWALRWINAEFSCTDSDGNCEQPDGSLAMAGSALDMVDHDAQDCYRPYDETDWVEGMAGFEDCYRLIAILQLCPTEKAAREKWTAHVNRWERLYEEAGS